MNTRMLGRLIVAGSALVLLSAAVLPDEKADQAAPPPSVAEARQRALLLHGTLHDTLQVVHARYFREDEALVIPAASLKDVFDEIAARDGIKLRWLVVDGRAMNIDHEPKDEFEKQAARALAAGATTHEATTADSYRFAGPITLKAECLKCHLPSRSSNKSRTAGLLISIPIRSEHPPANQ